MMGILSALFNHKRYKAVKDYLEKHPESGYSLSGGYVVDGMCHNGLFSVNEFYRMYLAKEE